MSLAVNDSKVPPGFRFHPTEEELLQHYLKKKLAFDKFDLDIIPDIDLNKLEPWDIQDHCRVGSVPQNDWYFYSRKDKKYPTGIRTNRATAAGFWKATGRDKIIYGIGNNNQIGMRKTLVFYIGRASYGKKSEWIIHEYRLEDCTGATYTVQHGHSSGSRDDNGTEEEEGWVICRLFRKGEYQKVRESRPRSLPVADDDIFSCVGKTYQDQNDHAHPRTNGTTTTSTFCTQYLPNTTQGRSIILNNNYCTIMPSDKQGILNSQMLSADDHQYNLPMLTRSSPPPFDRHHQDDPIIDLFYDNQILDNSKLKFKDWKTFDWFIASELNSQDKELMMCSNSVSLPMPTSNSATPYLGYDNQRLDEAEPALSDWMTLDRFIASELDGQDQEIMTCSNSVSLPKLSSSIQPPFIHQHDDDPVIELGYDNQRLYNATPMFNDGMTLDQFIASELNGEDQELMMFSNSVSLPMLTGNSPPPFHHHHDHDPVINMGYDNQTIDNAKQSFVDWMTFDRLIASKLNGDDEG